MGNIEMTLGHRDAMFGTHDLHIMAPFEYALHAWSC